MISSFVFLLASEFPVDLNFFNDTKDPHFLANQVKPSDLVQREPHLEEEIFRLLPFGDFSPFMSAVKCKGGLQ